MPIEGMIQPDIIPIEPGLRLRAWGGDYQPALPWYQDPVVYLNSEGISDPANIPDISYIMRMYDYLNRVGELYFIEVLENGIFMPIGDVTLKAENPPIAIGVARYRGVGIGRKVLAALLERGRQAGLIRFYGVTIYPYNRASQRLYERVGFRCTEQRPDEWIYEIDLTEKRD